MSATIQVKFGTLALDSTNNITCKPYSEKSGKPVQTTNIPVTDGAIAEEAKLGPKTITIEGDIAGSSYDDLRTNLDALHAGLLGQGLANLTIDDERYIYCQLKDFSKSYDHLTRRGTWSASFMAHYPFWLSTEENKLLNAGFELWTAGDAVAPDGYVLTGTNMSIAKEDTIIKIGAYSAAVTSPVGNGGYLQRNMTALLGGSGYFPGKVYTLGCWVYCDTANCARIALDDDVSAGSASSYHTGDSTWQYLTVTFTMTAGAITARILMHVEQVSSTVYFDEATVVEGANATASNVVDERYPTSGTGYTVNNPGNAPARAKIEITPTAEMADACKIENLTTGESFQYRGTVDADETLEIDNRYDTDDFEVLNNSVDDHANYEGDFITFNAGDNTIRFTGTASTVVKITFKKAWY